MSGQTNHLIRPCIIHIRPCTLLTNQISRPKQLKADAPLAKNVKDTIHEWEIAEGKQQGFIVKLVPK
jgi:hypothetical protein